MQPGTERHSAALPGPQGGRGYRRLNSQQRESVPIVDYKRIYSWGRGQRDDKRREASGKARQSAFPRMRVKAFARLRKVPCVDRCVALQRPAYRARRWRSSPTANRSSAMTQNHRELFCQASAWPK